MLRNLLCIAGVLCATVLSAQTAPVLTITFDESIDGQGEEGVITGTPVDAPSLAPGKVGKALKSGPGTGYVDYPTEGLLRPDAGTVEMWVCPLDWQPEDNEFHTFFDTRNAGALYLYKFHDGVRLLMLSCDRVTGPYFLSEHDLTWKPGEWHHIAGTWSPLGVMAYVDGRAADDGPTAASLPRSLGATFRIGDHPWHLARTSSSLIDEVRIYDRALSPAHIAAHYKGDYDFVAPLTPESVVMQCEPLPLDGQVQVILGTQGVDLGDEPLTAALAVVQQDAPLPAGGPARPFVQGRLECVLDIPAEGPATYDVVAAVQLDGKPFTQVRKELAIPETPWLGNRLGMEDKVLPPWTPLEVTEEEVACWGRTYSLADTAILDQVSSGGVDLLARPITLGLQSGEDAVTWTSGRQEAELSEPRTRLTSAGELAGTLGEQAVRVNMRRTVEYDGVMLVELSLPEGMALQADRMQVDIPLSSDRVIYRHRWAPQWAGITGDLPLGEGAVDSTAFIPYYWLGDNDRGLFWFCESDEMWPNGEAADAVQVVRSEAEVTLRLNILAPGQTLPANWRLVFGLQATPVKPLPKDWRRWRLQSLQTPEGDTHGNVAIIWPTPEKDSLRYYGYPEATDPELFSKRMEGLRQDGVKSVPYLCLSFLSAACEEWPIFGRHWSMGPVDSGSADVAAYGAGFAMVSPAGKGYSDFIVYRDKQFIDQYGIDGVYHDNTHPYPSTNLSAGVGYVRDGVAHRTFPILAYRDLYRRMYTIIKDLPRETFTMAHMSGKVTIPILAYEDSYLDGENFRGRVKDSYMDVISLDTFRAEFNGRQWGIMPFFIPEFPEEYRDKIEPTRGLMALLMVHDVAVWPIWCNPEVVWQAWDALDEFGYVDSQFIPYFAPDPPAFTEMPDVYASAYRRQDGRALVIVSNLSREDREGQVRLNAESLGVSVKRVVSWPDKAELALTEGSVPLSVPRLGYRMLVVGG